MGEVKEIICDAVDDLKSIFGSSRHTSGPTRTYRKRHEWDKKRKELQQKQSQLENERNLFVMESGRVPGLTATREERQARLQLLKEKLAVHREKIQEEQERLRVERERNICESAMVQCLKCARQTVENISENCPQLRQVTEEMAEAYCTEIQQRTDENFTELNNLHHSKVKEKLDKKQGYQEALSQKQQLEKVIKQLSELENKIK